MRSLVHGLPSSVQISAGREDLEMFQPRRGAEEVTRQFDKRRNRIMQDAEVRGVTGWTVEAVGRGRVNAP